MARRRFKGRIGLNRSVNIPRVVGKIATTGIALYVGNEILSAIGTVLNGTTGGFNEGFSLIGWTVTDGTIMDTSGGAILTVVGIVGFASVVMEFVKFNM